MDDDSINDIKKVEALIDSGKPLTAEQHAWALKTLGLPPRAPTQGMQPIVPPGALQRPTGASEPEPWTCCTGCTRAFWHKSPRHGWRAYCQAMGHWSAEAHAPAEAATECGHFEPRPGPPLAIEPRPGASRPARGLAGLMGRMVKAGRLLAAVPPAALGDVLEEMGQWVPRRSEWLAALGHWAPVRTPTRRQQKIIDTGLRCQDEPAQGLDVGYAARMAVLATLPHSARPGKEYSRKNGHYRLTIWSDEGLPYGTVPRLLLAWCTTEAVRTQSPQLHLGNNLSQFMERLGLVPTGGRWGTVPRLKTQARRLFASRISCTYDDGQTWRMRSVQVVDEADLWWSQAPGQDSLWESQLLLNQRFYQELVERPVPIDLRALEALRRSPLAIDIYLWLTYRVSYLKGRTLVPWPALEAQFGAEYGRARDFRTRFARQLKAVAAIYPVKATVDARGLELLPSAPHIRRLPAPG